MDRSDLHQKMPAELPANLPLNLLSPVTVSPENRSFDRNLASGVKTAR
jgi:hypothetical protein